MTQMVANLANDSGGLYIHVDIEPLETRVAAATRRPPGRKELA